MSPACPHRLEFSVPEMLLTQNVPVSGRHTARSDRWSPSKSAALALAVATTAPISVATAAIARRNRVGARLHAASADWRAGCDAFMGSPLDRVGHRRSA